MVTAVEGSDVSLPCSIFGNPATMYTWFKGQQEVTQYDIVVNGSLLLTSVTEVIEGTYSCTLSNLLGSETAFVTLDVKGMSHVTVT